MATLSTPLTVELDGGGDLINVTSDQRDLARWEASDVRDESAVHVRARFVAWSAMTRTGQYTGTWQDFNQRDCIEVLSAATDDDGEGEQGLDPGRRKRSGTG